MLLYVLITLALTLPLATEAFSLCFPKFQLPKNVERVTSASLLSLTLLTPLPPAHAAAPPPTQSQTYISGKTPGKKPDPNDTKGTRKDPTFLRAVSQCKSECEIKSDLDKSDCLQKCQDVVCGSYEQCSFAIIRLN
ncbi:hypothetical protein TrLO_g12298 [Triparma laevis f. longispina]|uniref:Uncharacterized protein n=1 Tax=Triparma laevis f. longispina TaxID=1714387 RepID=A0A9W7FQI7_9STRA|nr:hypothetical protein TrLO_g12298 [Triparma laevis f. longispina]